MRKKIKEFIIEHNLIINEPIICAVSGGVDSVCLIHILHDLGHKTILAHVNHHKRAQSEIEEAEMRKLAEELDIPFEVLEYHFDGNDNFHNDSHYARYDFFRELCKKYNTNCIATAHHLDDQLETILIKLLEGSNLYGYGGISICNDDSSYRIIRPLLCCCKDELYAYAEKQKYIYFEDSSNHEDDFLRNRIRHHIAPLLKKESSNLHEKVFQYSMQLKEAFANIRHQSIDYLNKTNNIIELDTFNVLDIALKKDILSLLLEQNHIEKNYRIIHDMLSILDTKNGTKHLILENSFQFIRSYDKARIKKNMMQKPKMLEIGLNDVKMYEDFGKFYFSKKTPEPNAKYIKLCYNSLELPFVIRGRIEGDEIELPIGRKKVSRVFVDAKTPKDKRDLFPIITDSKGKILWVYDHIKSKEVIEQKINGNIYFVCEEKSDDE